MGQPCDILETIEGGFAVYGVMWIIIFILLYISYLVRHAQEIERQNSKKDSSGPTSGRD
jgi:hypothetical protein